MKTVKLIQFISADHFDYGYDPDLFQWYELINLYSTYEFDEDDDYFELDAIEIRSISGKRRCVLNQDNNLKYNLIDIEVDDNSQLFVRR